MRKAAGVAAVLLCALVIHGCVRAKAEVKVRDGVRVVLNSSEGDNADAKREVLHTIWKSSGAAQSPFEAVLWADSDASGNLYVLDHASQRVTKLSRDGRVVAQFAGAGEGNGQLSKSSRLAWGDGRIYVANEGNGRIEVLSDAGQPLPSIQLPDVAKPGEVFFANNAFLVSRRFVKDGSYAYVYGRDWKLQHGVRKADPMVDRFDLLRSHNSVCPAPDGVWILSMLQNRIEKFAWDGRKILETSRDLDWKFPKDDNGRVIPEILVHRACTVDSSGNLYVVYSNPENWKRGNDVYKYAPDGRLLQKAFELPILNATMIRFDRDGSFLYSDGRTLTKASVERVQ